MDRNPTWENLFKDKLALAAKYKAHYQFRLDGWEVEIGKGNLINWAGEVLRIFHRHIGLCKINFVHSRKRLEAILN